MDALGIVVIGRNEGERLKKCLASVIGYGYPTVYVDSGSTDRSVELAQSMKVSTVVLDPSLAFSAARARNTGAEYLSKKDTKIEYIQFIDGDCVMSSQWLQAAFENFKKNEQAAIVCGRRREMFVEASVYNLLCDLEWNTPIGEAEACGGDAMMRVKALKEAGAYNPLLIAGEEPELCIRMRKRGWKILRIDADMTLHDAAMTKFYQWWKRAIRSGYAYAQVGSMYGAWGAREVLSVFFWVLVLPLVFSGTRLPMIVLSCIYLALLAKIAIHRLSSGCSLRQASIYAVFCILAKVPQFLGILKFCCTKISGKASRLIEYKSSQCGGSLDVNSHSKAGA